MASQATRALPGEYRFRLLRYAPNLVSGEFYNVAVLLYDSAGRIVDGRFAPDFVRMQCHPAVEVDYLQALRDEFEERRLLGQGFSEYVGELDKYLSRSLELTEPAAFFGAPDPALEIDRLVETYVASPARMGGQEAPVPGSRQAVVQRLDRTFRAFGLLARPELLRRDADVPYGAGRLVFRFDYAYAPPAGGEHFVHALGARNEINEAGRLCFVFERIRRIRESETSLTAVVDDTFSADARELLASSEVAFTPVSRADQLAAHVRSRVGL